MSLAAAREGVISALRGGIGWENEITTEYLAYQGLPVIVVEVGDFVGFTNQEQTAGQYELAVEMRLPIDAVEAAERHRDITIPTSMAGVLSRPHISSIRDAALILTSVEVGVEDEILADGSSRNLYIYVNAACELYTLPGVAEVLPADAMPPALDDDLSDVWGITIDNANNVLYLAEGTPATTAESDIHSYDLTTNTRRSSEITAGISQVQFHRGLDNDGTHLYLVDDDGTRGSWVLNKIGIATNSVDAIADLGAGNFSGCAVYGNGEFVTVAVDRGSTTDFVAFRTSDLTPVPEQNFSERFGEVAGALVIGPYAYDVVGSTAIATDANRRPDLDIDLGGFRIQWHDLARRGDYLWVSGTQDNGDGTQTGIIRAFKLPPVVAAAG